MKFGVFDLTEPINCLFFGNYLICVVCDIGIPIWMITLLWRECKNRFIDLFRIIQYSLIFVEMLKYINYSIRLIWPYVIEPTIFTIFNDLMSTIVLYYGLNQLSWFMLIKHINTYKLLREGHTFEDCKKKIKRTEIISFVTIIVLFIIYQGILMICHILNIHVEDYNTLRTDIILTEVIGIYLALAISEITLFCMLWKTMKNNLNYYYRTKWRRMSLVMIANITYFLLKFTISFLELQLRLDSRSLVGYSNKTAYRWWQRILYLCAVLAMNFGVFIFAVINTKNIRFKDWIRDIMIGNKIENKYDRASIFIIRNKLYKGNEHQNLLISSSSATSMSTSSYNDIEPDYEVTDDYMKNYKLIYATDSSNK